MEPWSGWFFPSCSWRQGLKDNFRPPQTSSCILIFPFPAKSFFFYFSWEELSRLLMKISSMIQFTLFERERLANMGGFPKIKLLLGSSHAAQFQRQNHPRSDNESYHLFFLWEFLSTILLPPGNMLRKSLGTKERFFKLFLFLFKVSARLHRSNNYLPGKWLDQKWEISIATDFFLRWKDILVAVI